jgi:hypothetical protein
MTDMATKRVLLELPGMDALHVQRDLDVQGVRTDVYTPPGPSRGTVVIVAGYPDAGFQKFVGCSFKDLGSTESWARLIAVSGMKVVTYANREPIADLHTVVGTLEPPIGIWASSGNAPLALSLLAHDAPVRVACAALCYPFTLDLDGATHVAGAASTYHFANPATGELRTDVPLFLARAGRDTFPGLNETLDRFVTHALTRNLPLTLVNHPEGPHAFDLEHDSDTTRTIVRQVLAFLRAHLATPKT